MSVFRRVYLTEWPTRDGEELTEQELRNEGYRIVEEYEGGWIADVACRCNQQREECTHRWGHTFKRGDSHPRGESRWENEETAHRFAGEVDAD